MKGNEIIVTPNPGGKFLEGIIDGTPRPGIPMQIQAGTALVNGRATFERYTKGTDGQAGPVFILLPDALQGRIYSDAYVDADRCFLYAPLVGEEMNIRVADNETVIVGDELLVKNSNSQYIVSTGTGSAYLGEASTPFQALETKTIDAANGDLVHAIFLGTF